MSHTPGPWTVEDLRTGSPFAKDWRGIGPNVVTAAGYERGGEPVAGVYISEANARLISAAPDLLEALQELIYDYRRDSRETRWHIADVLAPALRAIAKARGEQP